MKQWRCTVCGYIHKGAEPPEKCPVCGADRSKFEEIEPEAEPKVEAGPTTPSGPTASAAPVADRKPQTSTAKPQGFQKVLAQVHDLMVKYHAHPIAVHIPNGLLPVSVLFIFAAVIFKCDPLAIAAKYNMLMVLLAMPLVIYSGFTDWKRRFGGNVTSLFLTKMVCAGVVSALSLVVVLWMFIKPEITQGGAALLWLFLLLNLVLLAAAAVAGYLGGKLIIFPGDE